MILAIDPGFTSHVVLMDERGALLMQEAVDCRGADDALQETMRRTCKHAIALGATLVVVEAQFINPGSSKESKAAHRARIESAMRLSAIAAAWRSVAAGLGLRTPMVEVKGKNGLEIVQAHPKGGTWRARINQMHGERRIKNSGPSAAIKKSTVEYVQGFYPHVTDHNLADAIGIALAYRPLLKVKP